MPDVRGRSLNPVKRLFEGSHRSNRPHADQPRRFAGGGAPDLNRKSEHLGKQHAHEHDQVAIAAKNVHNSSG